MASSDETRLLEPAVVVTRMDSLQGWLRQSIEERSQGVVNWGRRYSLWPYVFATACCAMEQFSAFSPRYDISRFGAEIARWSPRQADLLWIVGTVTHKMAPVLRRVWEQMLEPKWAVAVGACASTGGFYDNYSVVQGADEIIPIDVYVAGCPPRPEQILDALVTLQQRITNEKGRVM
jgi:NADH-quinone oxidoreductase subunit B